MPGKTICIAPKGLFRVVGVDLFSHGDYFMGDHAQVVAFRVADEHNKRRKEPMDDVYYVYNDEGTLVRDQSAVSQIGVSP
ncbi:MAG TPA: hypothetical protein VFT82_01035 [Candidatus Paceibacterota bacterium]|nr:hypothetical protein [Candidatus Paceibacterota bacterium]